MKPSLDISTFDIVTLGELFTNKGEGTREEKKKEKGKKNSPSEGWGDRKKEKNRKENAKEKRK